MQKAPSFTLNLQISPGLFGNGGNSGVALGSGLGKGMTLGGVQSIVCDAPNA
jgi:hypothetical protein